ncbi:MAG: hypothetical protein ACF8LL_12175 [Phycisphaerales bacterium]
MTAIRYPSVDELGETAPDKIRAHIDRLFRVFFCDPEEPQSAASLIYIT